LILSVGLFRSDRFSDEGAHHAHHLAEDGFDAVSLEIEQPLAADRFQRFLEQLPDNVFRGKGVLWLDESEKRHIFHLVGQRFTLDEGAPVEPMKNKLVLIGRNLDHDWLRGRLEACVSAGSR
jgi:G3E family GTPase